MIKGEFKEMPGENQTMKLGTHNSDVKGLGPNAQTHQSNDEGSDSGKLNEEQECHVPIRASLQHVRTLSISLFNVVGGISSTSTVIKLPTATHLYAATLPA